MAEEQYPSTDPAPSESTSKTINVSIFMLFFGICGLGVTTFVLSDGALWRIVDPRWIIAGAALIIGLALLLKSLRSKASTDR